MYFKLVPDSEIIPQSVHVYINELNDKLEALQTNQNKIVKQSSSFLKDASLGELNISVASSSKLIPSILDHSVRSIKLKDLVPKFEENPHLKPGCNISTHKNFDELQKLNTTLKGKIIKLKAKFEGNLENQSALTNTNMKSRVESLQKRLQDAKKILNGHSSDSDSCK